jgi:hypothetical protein
MSPAIFSSSCGVIYFPQQIGPLTQHAQRRETLVQAYNERRPPSVMALVLQEIGYLLFR